MPRQHRPENDCEKNLPIFIPPIPSQALPAFLVPFVFSLYWSRSYVIVLLQSVHLSIRGSTMHASTARYLMPKSLSDAFLVNLVHSDWVCDTLGPLGQLYRSCCTLNLAGEVDWRQLLDTLSIEYWLGSWTLMAPAWCVKLTPLIKGWVMKHRLLVQ